MPFVIDLTKDPIYKKGEKEGIEKEKIAIATSLLDILDDKNISQRVGLPPEKVKKLRKDTIKHEETK